MKCNCKCNRKVRRNAKIFSRVNDDIGMTDDPRGLTPEDIYAYYNFNSNISGAGRKIAVVDAYYYPTALADLQVFSSTFNLAEPNLEVVFPDGRPGINSDWITESALDIQWAHAMAPDAEIMLISVADNSIQNLMNGVRYAVENGADVVSMSWGVSEFANEENYDRYFAASDVAFVASAGDIAARPIYPSVSSLVLSVGGTRLNIDNNGELISETAWDESGGGPSRYISMPIWQRTFGLQSLTNGYNRATPDVAFNADPDSGVSVYITDPFSGEGNWNVIGGTSLGAPAWAGIIASLGLNTTDVGRIMYDLAGRTGYTNPYGCFYDITSGSSGEYRARVGYDLITGLGTPNISCIDERA